MAATIEYNGQRATVTNGEWKGQKELVETLNVFLGGTDPFVYEPNPDQAIAQDAVDRLGAKMVSFDKPKFDPKVDY